jgi:hypothetical protein
MEGIVSAVSMGERSSLAGDGKGSDNLQDTGSQRHIQSNIDKIVE